MVLDMKMSLHTKDGGGGKKACKFFQGGDR